VPDTCALLRNNFCLLSVKGKPELQATHVTYVCKVLQFFHAPVYIYLFVFNPVLMFYYICSSELQLFP